MSELRVLVSVWQSQVAIAQASFEHALARINSELQAVGGFATTSPHKGTDFCLTYERHESGFGGSQVRIGERIEWLGPKSEIVAPFFPEVGDRCYELEQAWRVDAERASSDRHAVLVYLIEHGAVRNEPETVALVLCKSEESERAVIVKLLRSIGKGRVDEYGGDLRAFLTLADYIETGDHLR